MDDIDRKISSPLLQHAMSAFFNTTKILPPPPTGPKSIRMSSNASMLYPIREEAGGKVSIYEDDILDEVDSSPRSSISTENRLKDMEKENSIVGENIKERRGTNVIMKLPKDQQLQLDTDTPKTNRPSQFKDKSFPSFKLP
mmetsp:Transcript_24071/g.26736  ORF Transcript_24071/g.26736 Transcript_24071/m.26736 type:complete len:141 (-) Transcript_24071:16-438(-)